MMIEIRERGRTDVRVLLVGLDWRVEVVSCAEDVVSERPALERFYYEILGFGEGGVSVRLAGFCTAAVQVSVDVQAEFAAKVKRKVNIL